MSTRSSRRSTPNTWYAAYSRSTWRTVNPGCSAAIRCVVRRSAMRLINARRSNSFGLMAQPVLSASIWASRVSRPQRVRLHYAPQLQSPHRATSNRRCSASVGAGIYGRYFDPCVHDGGWIRLGPEEWVVDQRSAIVAASRTKWSVSSVDAVCTTARAEVFAERSVPATGGLPRVRPIESQNVEAGRSAARGSRGAEAARATHPRGFRWIWGSGAR